MPSIEVSRHNCDQGKWGIPDTTPEANNWGSLYDVAEHHLNERGQPSIEEILSQHGKIDISFVHLNPTDVGKHAVPGTLIITWGNK